MSNEIKVVFRHIRPDVYGIGLHEYHSNLYGITVRYEIDYNSYTVRASWSICRGDNFEKVFGRKKTTYSKAYSYRLDTNKPLSLLLFENLVEDTQLDISAKEWVPGASRITDFYYEDIEKVFLKASRMQKEETL